jgi:hypothetical protein
MSAPVTSAAAVGYSYISVRDALDALAVGETDLAIWILNGALEKLTAAIAPELVPALTPSFARQHSEEAH